LVVGGGGGGGFLRGWGGGGGGGGGGAKNVCKMQLAYNYTHTVPGTYEYVNK
jgi:hypothetical protein